MKDEKGSISLFVLISLLFLVLIILGIYMRISGQEISGIQETQTVQNIYNQDTNSIENIYSQTLIKNGYVKNGLIMYYDSINNSENGHNANATIWKDLSTNEYDGQVIGDWEENALICDGANSFVTSHINQTNFSNGMTISTRFYTNSINDNKGIFGNYITEQNKGIKSEFTNGSLIIGYNTNNVTANANNLNEKLTTLTITIKQNVGLKVYINGELVAQNNSLTDTVEILTDFWIGRDAANRYFYGKINNFLIYNKILTDEEIEANYELDTIKYANISTEEIETQNEWNGSVNIPKIKGTGLTPINIADNGTITQVTNLNSDWYEYVAQVNTTENGGTSRWANAITKNDNNEITGMFVWIPRFAYKITNGYNTSSVGSIDVVFLKGETDKYQIGQTEYTAHRLTENNVDVTANYYVHPCFTKTVDESQNNTYNQGEWDKELTGIWVAKFEAGFAGGKNTVTQRNSNISYGAQGANYYGEINANVTNIKYPVFLPKTYSYNCITINDSFRISREIANGNTYYNLNNNKTDSHMMKNSEWGAVAYLAHSKYGRNGTEIRINNVFLYTEGENGNICGITGYAATDTDSNTRNVTSIPESDCEWTGTYGKKASSTGNVYGIYDLSGGLYEFVAGYIENTNGENARNTNGNSLTSANGKYKTTYSYNNSTDARWDNYLANETKRGDAIYETSYGTSGTTDYNNSWNTDYSYFPYTSYPFFLRGAYCVHTSVSAGVFAFNDNNGESNYYSSWRICIAI